MDWLTTLTTALGAAWLSGILGVLSHPWIIGLAVTLYLVEFVADKIPAVDSVWDAIHTFIRVPAGAVLAASAFADFDPPVRVAALLIGGGLALGSHGSKAVTRVTVNSLAPGAGAAVSVAEDVLAVGFSALMTFFPLVFLALLILALIGMAWLVPRIARALR